MLVFKQGPLSKPEIEQWLHELRGNPHVPGSGFDVTTVYRASVGDKSDYYFAGVNAENIDNRSGTHGEEGAIAAMVAGLGKRAVLQEGFILAAPRGLTRPSQSPMADITVPSCGNCRQRQMGFAASPDMEVHSISLNGAEQTYKISNLLPGAFSFRDFAPELAAEQAAQTFTHTPTAQQVEQRLIREKPQTEKAVFDWLNDLESVDFASKTSQAVVLRLANGSYVGGTKVEDSAYTGTNAVQSATAIATANYGTQKVAEVWCLSKGRDEKIFEPDARQALSLSAVQTLLEYGATPLTKIHLFNAQGKAATIQLKDTPYFAPSFSSALWEHSPDMKDTLEKLTQATISALRAGIRHATVDPSQRMVMHAMPHTIAHVRFKIDASHYPQDPKLGQLINVEEHVAKTINKYLSGLSAPAPSVPRQPVPFNYGEMQIGKIDDDGKISVSFMGDYLQLSSILHDHSHILSQLGATCNITSRRR